MSEHQGVDVRAGDRSPRELELIERVRALTAGLPGVVVTVDGFGHTTFRAGKKSFAIVGAGHGAGSLIIKTDSVTQDALVRRGPWIFSPYIGRSGWILAWGEDAIDWEEVAELLIDGFRLVAPRRLLRELDQRSEP